MRATVGKANYRHPNKRQVEAAKKPDLKNRLIATRKVGQRLAKRSFAVIARKRVVDLVVKFVGAHLVSQPMRANLRH